MGKRYTLGGGFALGIGALMAVVFGSAHSTCESGLGQLAQGLSSSAANTCATDNFAFYLGVAGVVVGAVLLITGVASRSRQPQVPPPVAPNTPPAGWYPDPTGSGSMQWWDGTQWVRSYAPPPRQATPQG